MKHVTCDICGREIVAGQDHAKLTLYYDYVKPEIVKSSKRKMDICRDCSDRMLRHMRNKMDEENKPDVAN